MSFNKILFFASLFTLSGFSGVDRIGKVNLTKGPWLLATYTDNYRDADHIVACAFYSDGSVMLIDTGLSAERKPIFFTLTKKARTQLDKKITETFKDEKEFKLEYFENFNAVPKSEDYPVLGVEYRGKNEDFLGGLVKYNANSSLGKHIRYVCGFKNDL